MANDYRKASVIQNRVEQGRQAIGHPKRRGTEQVKLKYKIQSGHGSNTVQVRKRTGSIVAHRVDTADFDGKCVAVVKLLLIAGNTLESYH